MQRAMLNLVMVSDPGVAPTLESLDARWSRETGVSAAPRTM